MDGLYNNAGVLLDDLYTAPQGNEMHFEVNTLTPYTLTIQLKPLFDNANAPFVINTVTGGLHRQKSLDVDELLQPSKFVKLFGPYLKSKLALTQITNNLAKNEAWSKVRILNLDSGLNKTKMTKASAMPAWLLPLRNLFFPSPTVGAKKLYNAAFLEELQGKTGVYVSGNKAQKMLLVLTEGEKSKLLSGIK